MWESRKKGAEVREIEGQLKPNGALIGGSFYYNGIHTDILVWEKRRGYLLMKSK